jgi:NADH:ubiquinone oxidoreductase subunit 5 (subunit L)/multisubunit Na+/H+ antiporter MnhA subunit
MEVFIMVYWISSLFIRLVLIITPILLLYKVGYIRGDKFIRRFLFLMTIFVVSISMDDFKT